jgi:hydrogenase-4 component F
MDGSLEFLLLLGLPLLGAGVSLSLGEPRRVLAWSGVWVGAWALVAFEAASRVFQGEALDGASRWLMLDALSAYHLCVMAVVFVLSTAFAYFYFGREVDEGKLSPRIARRFGMLWAGALFAMTLVLSSNNLGIMWVGVEFTTLSTAFLIRLHVTHESLEATWKYLVICSVGVALAFLGVVFVAASARAVLPSGEEATMWTSLVAVSAKLDPGLAKAGFLFVLVGFGTKAGLAPMHTWLPDAHSQAPGPVSAVFSGSLLNAALYCILRYVPIVEGATGRSGFALSLLVVFGLGSLLLAAAFMVFQRDIKRLLAYSSVEHIGIITLGIGLGPLGTFAALFHVLNHSVSKSVAFLAAGRLAEAYGGSEIARMRGAARAQPLWGGALVASLLSLVGAAPFAVFLSEFLVLQAAAAAGAWAVVALLVLGLGIVFAGVVVHLVAIGWGEPSFQTKVSRAGPFEAATVVVPLAALVVLGLFMPGALRDALDQAVRVVGGGL